MKFPVIGGIVFLLSGLGALVALSYFNDSQPIETVAATSTASESTTPTETVVFHVPDMSCDVVCTPTVRKTLAAIPGVEKVETDLEQHTATLVTSSDFDESKALAALSDAGYPAERAAN